jgi:hypothetical protein
MERQYLPLYDAEGNLIALSITQEDYDAIKQDSVPDDHD